MSDIAALLAHHNIKLPSYSPGRYYTTCPWCSARRQAAHQKLKCLGVTIKPDKVYWGCNHCGATGPQHGARDDLPHYDYGDNRKSRVDGRYVWEHRDESGGWTSGKTQSESADLYRIDEALETSGVILVVEGEKDVDTLWKNGFAATCGPHGANTWTAAHSEALRGRDIVVLNDNDEPGYKYAAKVVQHSLPVAASVKRLDLKDYWPGIGPGDDVSDWFYRGSGFAEHLNDIIAELPVIDGHAPDPTSLHGNDVPPAAQTEKIARIDLAAWEGRPVPDQQWTVQNRFPRGEVALLSGAGAVGKSLIALHLCAAIALGRDWLGAMPEPGAAMFIEAEDRADVLWRRLEALRQHYGSTYRELNERLHLFSLHAQPAVMASADRSGVVHANGLFKSFCDIAAKIKPQIIVLPASANIFTGNENDRSQVSQFIHILGTLADETNGTVLLITHPSLSGNNKNGGQDHQGLSGSTAWHNAARARCVLATEGEVRTLEFFKNQYGSAEEKIILEWADGMLKPQGGTTQYEQAAKNAADEAAVMTVFRRVAATTTIGADRTSRNHPAPLFAQEPEIVAAKMGKRHIMLAVERLTANGTLKIEEYGPPSHRHKKLVVP
jgi:RecA-family ATPase